MTSRTSMPTWRYLVRMIRYAPGICLAHAVLWATSSALGLAPGLIGQRFFDTLTGDTHVPGGTDSLVALLAILAVADAALVLVAGSTEITMRFTMSGLLRQNMLRRLLERPGAAALPMPLGEAISRFRDDAYIGEDTLDWTDETIGAVSQAIRPASSPWQAARMAPLTSSTVTGRGCQQVRSTTEPLGTGTWMARPEMRPASSGISSASTSSALVSCGMMFSPAARPLR